MIFVTVGTTDFDLLVASMDELAGSTTEQVVAQIGRGDYVPEQMDWFRFAPSLDPYYDGARVVVAHGGLGTLVEVLQRRLPLIGVSNPDRYDHHQEDILATMERRGHMIWCRTLADLPQALDRIETMDVTPYDSPPCHIAQVIRDYLQL